MYIKFERSPLLPSKVKKSQLSILQSSTQQLQPGEKSQFRILLSRIIIKEIIRLNDEFFFSKGNDWKKRLQELQTLKNMVWETSFYSNVDSQIMDYIDSIIQHGVKGGFHGKYNTFRDELITLKCQVQARGIKLDTSGDALKYVKSLVSNGPPKSTAEPNWDLINELNFLQKQNPALNQRLDLAKKELSQIGRTKCIETLKHRKNGQEHQIYLQNKHEQMMQSYNQELKQLEYDLMKKKKGYIKNKNMLNNLKQRYQEQQKTEDQFKEQSLFY